jgi:hypothetical protein
MARRKTNFWESAVMNNATYIQYYNRLIELSIAMFDWTGLPDTIDPRFLELTLFKYGQAVFFEDEVMGYLALTNAVQGGFDVYGYPVASRAYSPYNNYQKNLTLDDSVIIYNNYLRTPSSLDVEVFAKRLYNLDRVIDVNANAQKTPVLIKCAETQRLTMKNLYKEFDGNSPVIFGDNGMNDANFTVLSTEAPYVADRIYQLKTQIWNEALTYLGISNINVQKKERLITDEVSRNMGGVIASRYSRLNARQNACEKINKMFGLNVWCEYRDDYRELDEELEDVNEDDDEQEPEVKENE